ELFLCLLSIRDVLAGQRLEQLLVAELAQLRPRVHCPRRERRLLLRPGPGDAVDAAVLAIAPGFAQVARLGAPINDVQCPVRPDDDLARTEKRVVACEEVELLHDLDAGAGRFGARGNDPLAGRIGVKAQSAVALREESVVAGRA